MLDAMRRNTRVVLWITIIFFVLLIFLVWGADLQFGNDPQTSNNVGVINGEPISALAYQQLLSYNRDNARSGGRDLGPTDELLLQEQTWNSLIDDMLVRQEADRRGLGATDAEVRSILLYDPPAIITQNPDFRNENGVFDLAAYQAVITAPSTPESFLLQLEAYVRDSLPQQKLQDLVAGSAKVTEDEVRRAWLEQTERAVIQYVIVPASGGAEPQVDDAAVRTWFDNNTDDYKLPRRATLKYVSVPRIATAQDSADLFVELRELADEAREAASAAAAGNTGSTYSDFETLTLTFSDLPNADQGGLSQRPAAISDLSPAYRDAISGLAEGAISEPFKEGSYVHIVQLVERIPAVAVEGADAGTDSVRVRDLGIEIAPSDSTLLAVRDELDQVRMSAAALGLEKAAEGFGLTVQSAANVTGAGIVPGLTALPQIGSFALDNAPGTVSRVLETNTAWFLVEVASHQEPGAPEFDAVKDRVRQDVVADRRLQAARALAESVITRVQQGDSLAAAAQAESLLVGTSPSFTRAMGIPGLGRDANVVGAAFALPVGEVSQPIEGTRRWVVLKVLERPEVDWTVYEAQRLQVQQSILNTRQVQIFNAWLDSLRRGAKIQDQRT